MKNSSVTFREIVSNETKFPWSSCLSWDVVWRPSTWVHDACRSLEHTMHIYHLLILVDVCIKNHIISIWTGNLCFCFWLVMTLKVNLVYLSSVMFWPSMVLLLVVQEVCGFLCAFSTCVSVAIVLLSVFNQRTFFWQVSRPVHEFASNVEYRKDLT